MLTPEQIAALGDAAAQVAVPINEYLIKDIARRIATAGQFTSTAAYQIYRAQQLGLSRRQIKQMLRKELNVSHEELRRLLTQSAEVGYNFDINKLSPFAVPFAENASVQQMVAAAVTLARKDFTNLTQTLGMIAPDGKAYPLQKAYQKSCDFAFQQVFTGATDYNTAMRQACRNISDMGVRVIDYESGVHTGLEAAVRRNVMGGMGLMQEQISQYNHDELGANGWEISAHGGCAPDHEPIQGRQYSDADYQRINGSLVRRIGTLNCGHMASPIILGINDPQYTEQELQQLERQNTEGVIYQGRQYSLYEASQKQRQIERAMRRQKNRALVAEVTGDKYQLQISQIKLGRLGEEYKQFSLATGLRTQRERLEVSGFGRGQAERATVAQKALQKGLNSDIINSKGGAAMPVDVTVEMTPCLVNRKTGVVLDTTVQPVSLTKQQYAGWNFDWSIPQNNEYRVHALRVVGDETIQGLIATKLDHASRAVHLDIVETAPHNFGHTGQYEGVGAHLFAFACKEAHDNGYDYIYFDAKTNLIDYYKEQLGAKQVGSSQRMILEDEGFIDLLNTYYGRE